MVSSFDNIYDMSVQPRPHKCSAIVSSKFAHEMKTEGPCSIINEPICLEMARF